MTTLYHRSNQLLKQFHTAGASMMYWNARMRIAVIGGTGHIGTYRIPRLVDAGFETISISRGMRQPYLESGAWRLVERIVLYRQMPGFETAVASLCADAIIDLTCYTPESAQRLVDALRGRGARLLHCGSIW